MPDAAPAVLAAADYTRRCRDDDVTDDVTSAPCIDFADLPAAEGWLAQ